ncbi:ribosome recycling factor [Aerococcaceae bacterium NML180378]|nr:ribosome recycling factor [Aerococcaceae bacterium NML180378]
MSSELLKNTKERMQKSVDAYQRELASIRAGRANASILDRVNVVYYGAPIPLNQLASVTVPEARMLLITPYDKGILTDIEKAILQSDVGITPSNDGSVIRLTIPALTQERRMELAKQVGKEQEGAKVAIRNIRRDAMDAAKKLEKEKEITEDDLKNLEKDIQKLTDDFVKAVEKATADKEKEILEK